MAELDDFYHEFLQEVRATADAVGSYVEDAFFEMFCDYLTEAGELEQYERAAFESSKGLRVDGYGGDPLGSEDTLTLILCDLDQTEKVSSLTATSLKASFKRCLTFLQKSMDSTFRNSLDESAPAFGLAELINKRWSSIAKVRIIILTNRSLSSRIDGFPAGRLHGTPVTYNVWDINRLYRFVASGQRESIEIDLRSDFGGPIPALMASLKSADYEALLAVVPAQQLADIYDRWGARLLERNVRVFLQARGNVNKGIKNTIENDPEMFFAYNNGITATADGVTTEVSKDGLLLTHIKNLQIVNGGQTTASIHQGSRNKSVDLSRVFVQMKLSVIQPDRTDEVVPKISEYANSQNRVNAADFFANHPFHVRMEGFSRRLYAPSQDGTFRESKWFYERARGQYQDARAILTVSQRSKFDLEYPKKQLMSKTDFAKYLNLWRGHPDLVSKGAQKNFAHFAGKIGEEWSKQSDEFNEEYFRNAVAKAIVFRATEKIVTEQDWYQGGYRANVVAYAISKIAYDVERMKKAVDFDRVWRRQQMSDAFARALAVSAELVHEVIVNPESGAANVTEWAKQQACWARIQSLRIDWPDIWIEELLSSEEQQSTRRSASRTQKTDSGIHAQTIVITAGADLWRSVIDWAKDQQLLSPTETGILEVAAAIPNRLPSDRQSVRTLEILKRLHSEGCNIGRDLL